MKTAMPPSRSTLYAVCPKTGERTIVASGNEHLIRNIFERIVRHGDMLHLADNSGINPPLTGRYCEADVTSTPKSQDAKDFVDLEILIQASEKRCKEAIDKASQGLRDEIAAVSKLVNDYADATAARLSEINRIDVDGILGRMSDLTKELADSRDDVAAMTHEMKKIRQEREEMRMEMSRVICQMSVDRRRLEKMAQDISETSIKVRFW